MMVKYFQFVLVTTEDSTTIALFCQNNKAWAGGSIRTAPTLFGDCLTLGCQSKESIITEATQRLSRFTYSHSATFYSDSNIWGIKKHLHPILILLTSSRRTRYSDAPVFPDLQKSGLSSAIRSVSHLHPLSVSKSLLAWISFQGIVT